MFASFDHHYTSFDLLFNHPQLTLNDAKSNACFKSIMLLILYTYQFCLSSFKWVSIVLVERMKQKSNAFVVILLLILLSNMLNLCIKYQFRDLYFVASFCFVITKWCHNKFSWLQRIAKNLFPMPVRLIQYRNQRIF